MKRCIRLKEQNKFIKNLEIGVVGALTRINNECLQCDWQQAVKWSQLQGSLDISFLDLLVFSILELPLLSCWKNSEMNKTFVKLAYSIHWKWNMEKI